MKTIFKRLFTPDYDTSLIREWDRDLIGSSYRHSITWFRAIAHSFVVSFMIILVVYSLGTLENASENIKQFLLNETIAYGVLLYVGVVGFIIGTSWLLVGRYGRNTKSAVLAYYTREFSYYKNQIEKERKLPASQVEFHWNNLTSDVKRDAIVVGYQTYCFKNGYSDQVAESFMRTLNADIHTYESLPTWLKPYLSVHDRFYYWDKEKMDLAENALKAFAE